MSFLQQPVLFASEPSNSLVGLGLLITLTAVCVVVTALVAIARTTRESRPSEDLCQERAAPTERECVCPEVAVP